jgi:RNA polymerase sigma-70 factor, ECF subfamily
MQSRTGIEKREEDRLVADFLARRRGGLENAYRAHGTSLYSIARSVLGNDDDAQDCVHDALLRVWQRADSYRPERGPLGAFLRACVRNEALSRRRNAARHFHIEERLAKSERHEYEIDVTDHVERTRLRSALGELPPEQRVALELAYFGGLSQTQIAERLDVPLGTIKSRLAMAVRKLRAAMGATEKREDG